MNWKNGKVRTIRKSDLAENNGVAANSNDTRSIRNAICGIEGTGFTDAKMLGARL
jgi:hypothetical protein